MEYTLADLYKTLEVGKLLGPDTQIVIMNRRRELVVLTEAIRKSFWIGGDEEIASLP